MLGSRTRTSPHIRANQLLSSFESQLHGGGEFVEGSGTKKDCITASEALSSLLDSLDSHLEVVLQLCVASCCRRLPESRASAPLLKAAQRINATRCELRQARQVITLNVVGLERDLEAAEEEVAATCAQERRLTAAEHLRAERAEADHAIETQARVAEAEAAAASLMSAEAEAAVTQASAQFRVVEQLLHQLSGATKQIGHGTEPAFENDTLAHSAAAEEAWTLRRALEASWRMTQEAEARAAEAAHRTVRLQDELSAAQAAQSTIAEEVEAAREAALRVQELEAEVQELRVEISRSRELDLQQEVQQLKAEISMLKAALVDTVDTSSRASAQAQETAAAAQALAAAEVAAAEERAAAAVADAQRATHTASDAESRAAIALAQAAKAEEAAREAERALEIARAEIVTAATVDVESKNAELVPSEEAEGVPWAAAEQATALEARAEGPIVATQEFGMAEAEAAPCEAALPSTKQLSSNGSS